MVPVLGGWSLQEGLPTQVEHAGEGNQTVRKWAGTTRDWGVVREDASLLETIQEGDRETGRQSPGRGRSGDHLLGRDHNRKGMAQSKENCKIRVEYLI